ncbi:MAG: hypothetical protein IIC63_04850 [Proteobacteria bacterium]|nr:hypothetical protein [Pseudomonadota bacterium]
MQKPKLLMLDEPSLGLSPKLQKDFFKTILKLRKDDHLTILIVEQNAKKAIEIADRTYLLEDGKMVLSGERPSRDGSGTSLHRITWTPREDGAVRQLWEVSKDNGSNWSVLFDGLYEKQGQER